MRFTKLPKQLRLRYIQVKKPQPPAEDADKPTKAKYEAALKDGAGEDRGRGGARAQGRRGLPGGRAAGLRGRDDGGARRRLRLGQRRGHGHRPRPGDRPARRRR
ncbi:MAG: hypothetical protein V9G14_15460 [Cypionkella sp.]